MDAPDTSKKLEDSIRKVGTCTKFCDEKERVDRMFENLVDLAETVGSYHIYRRCLAEFNSRNRTQILGKLYQSRVKWSNDSVEPPRATQINN